MPEADLLRLDLRQQLLALDDDGLDRFSLLADSRGSP
jgi:hypothetical protein